MLDHMTVVVMSIAFIVGTVATVAYYFARYYFRTSDQDNELAIGVKKEDLPLIEKDTAVEIPKTTPAEEPVLELVSDKATPVEVSNKKAPELKVVEPEAAEVIELKTEVEPTVKKEEVKAKAPAKDLKDALKNTKAGIFGRIKEAFSKNETLSDDDIETLEEILYTSDMGPQTVQRLMESVSENVSSEEKANLENLRRAIKDEMLSIFSDSKKLDLDTFFSENRKAGEPWVLMVVGVNGAGKTTTIGKLAHKASNAGLKTLVVAGDTFRAAAEEQLKVWSDRANVEIFNPEGVKDPSAVAFDGLQMAKGKGFDVVIVDTAGRLHTQDNLMEELKKMKRVMKKVLPSAPDDTFIVLDANSGQNALMQAKSFNESLDLSGVVLTKLDGSAKGGVAVGLAYELKLPIKFIGVGESVEDLRTFDSSEFVDSII